METPKFTEIEKVELTKNDAKLTLNDGVTVHISVNNDNYIHLSFSGVEGLKVAANVHYDGIPSLKLSNYFDIKYEPYKRE